MEARHVHSNTTSVSVQGDYEYEDAPLEIAHGYSKDKRPDLKQFIVSMLCVDRNIPIIGTVGDGNASDKKINNDILTDISRHMAVHGLKLGEFVYIADFAMVTEANLREVGDGTKFLSRLLAIYNECGGVIKESVQADAWIDIGVLAKTKPTKNRPATHYLWLLLIPDNSSTHSGVIRPPIPGSSVHPFRGHPSTRSGVIRPPVPGSSVHPFRGRPST